VRYEAAIAMLLNEISQRASESAETRSRAWGVNARLKKQETQLQKVSAQIDVRKTARQLSTKY
jgi:hypothetical protein